MNDNGNANHFFRVPKTKVVLDFHFSSSDLSAYAVSPQEQSKFHLLCLKTKGLELPGMKLHRKIEIETGPVCRAVGEPQQAAKQI